MANGFLHRRSLDLKFGPSIGESMQKPPKKKEKCKNCEGKGLVKLGDKKAKCQRCGGTGFKASAPTH